MTPESDVRTGMGRHLRLAYPTAEAAREIPRPEGVADLLPTSVAPRVVHETPAPLDLANRAPCGQADLSVAPRVIQATGSEELVGDQDDTQPTVVSRPGNALPGVFGGQSLFLHQRTRGDAEQECRVSQAGPLAKFDRG